jgi:hypothetical protein
MLTSSKPVAGVGIGEAQAEEGEADRQHDDVEHVKPLAVVAALSRPQASMNRCGRRWFDLRQECVSVREGKTDGDIRIL